MSDIIDDELRRAFVAIADVLIPAYGDLPAASGADVGGQPLDHILTLRDDLKPDFFRGLRTAVGKPPEGAARALNQSDPKALAAIGLVASAVYYMNPEVRKKIGYPGQDRSPIDPNAPAEYLRDNLLQPVISRGAIYRPTPRC
jgi:hypothetical protein